MPALMAETAPCPAMQAMDTARLEPMPPVRR